MMDTIIIIAVLLAVFAVIASLFLSNKNGTSTEPESDASDDVPDATLSETIAPTQVIETPEDDGEVEPEVLEEDPVTEETVPEKITISIRDDIPTLLDMPEETHDLLDVLFKKLPKLPTVAVDILPVLSQPGAGAKEVAKIIDRDQAIAARMLRWVNSSFYGLQGKVTSLQRAVVIFGMDTTRSLVLEDAFSRNNQLKGLPGLSPETIWAHAAAVSITAKHLARHIRGLEPDVAATSGLMHDIGIMLLLIMERRKLGEALEASRSARETLIKHEFDILGFNHQIWGESFTRAWQLPEEIAVAIGKHHCPLKEPFDPLAATVWLSGYIVSYLGYACPEDEIPKVDEDEIKELMGKLGLRNKLESYVSQSLVREIVNTTQYWKQSEATVEFEQVTR